MKRILIAAMALTLGCGQLMAQKETPLTEKDVDINYVNDFQRQQPGAKDVVWWRAGEDSFRATYIDAEGSQQAMVFSPRGTETLYYVDTKYCPRAIADTVARQHPGYEVDKVWVRKVRGKYTYQAQIATWRGMLWWRKKADAKVLEFEIDGKQIS
ncbi:MAG: hypothetical protein IJU19_03480 [Bacteroidales bacterium]|nr:hypothetical protein [Bacteroidales bacterium]